MKVSPISELSNEEISLIANRARDEAASIRAKGHKSPAYLDIAAKFGDYIVVLRGQDAGEKKPGLRQQAV